MMTVLALVFWLAGIAAYFRNPSGVTTDTLFAALAVAILAAIWLDWRLSILEREVRALRSVTRAETARQ